MNTLKKYKLAIKNKVWTENDIIYFRKYLGPTGSPNIDTKFDLLKTFQNKAQKGRGYKITEEQSQKGINWMMGWAFKKNGEPRQSKDMTLGERELAILKNFKEFRFVDLYEDQNHVYSGQCFYTPIYRVYSKKGEFFEYTTNMGKITVLRALDIYIQKRLLNQRSQS